ncbi:MAG: hypothetical protein OEW48_05790 [Phycisphaerae bacterium]|nr:hypothetical protein [Phycisphaerae bacterium]
MIAFDPNSTCEQAKAHYYDYLFGDTKECVSTHMLGHIDGCSSCQAEVRRLKVILAEGEDQTAGSARQATTAITTYLRFHFVYLRAFVDCKILKLFLPSLAIPALEVSVPTPITVHLDNCQKCTSDLKAIRRLKLTSKQLGRLGQLFAEEPGINAHICSEAQNAIASVGAMVFEGASPEILRHLCICPECRKKLYEDRRGRSEKLPRNSEQTPMPCDAVSPADIFDYVIPYGIEPDHDPHVMFRKSLTSHLINCPRCLDKMQKLHDTVYSILERQESGIVTCYEICGPGQESTDSSYGDLYRDWPIEVQVFDNSVETETVETRETSAAEGIAVSPGPEPERKFSFLRRPFIKPAAAAAAAILLAFLLLNIPAARAVNLDQISRALERIRNVYFATSVTKKAVPTQEIWISQALNIKIVNAKDKSVLWDIEAKSQKTRDLNTGSIATIPLNTDVFLNVKEIITGLLPLNSMHEVPEGAEWLPVADEDIETVIPGTQVYDLIWTEKHLIGSVTLKWRGYIDIKKKLPKRIERWDKFAQEQEYKRESVTEVSYPTDDEMKAVIKKAGF